ncbi:MAG: vitamin K epoxide reductase family protein [Acidimicrobiales bacterium]|jgi:uncharacterized membrane protein
MTSVRPRSDGEVDVEVEDVDGGPLVPAWRPWTAFALSLVGFGISLYLTIDHFSGVLPLCSSSGFINCALVTTSKYSYLLHIPVALLGLIFYTGLVVVNLPPLWRARAPWVAWVRLAMLVGGIGFVLYLLGAELLSLGSICIWCTGVHIVTFLLFVLVVMSFPAMSGRRLAFEGWDEDEDEFDDDEDAGPDDA